MSRIPAVLTGLCDDAAIFPPGSLPLAEAVPAHLRHLSSDYADLVGPLVLSASAVGELTPLVGHLAPGAVSATVTVPAPDAIPAVLATLAALPAVRLAALEVTLPQGLPADEVVPALDAALASLPARESGEGPGEGAEPTVFVELGPQNTVLSNRALPDDASLSAVWSSCGHFVYGSFKVGLDWYEEALSAPAGASTGVVAFHPNVLLRR